MGFIRSETTNSACCVTTLTPLLRLICRFLSAFFFSRLSESRSFPFSTFLVFQTQPNIFSRVYDIADCVPTMQRISKSLSASAQGRSISNRTSVGFTAEKMQTPQCCAMKRVTTRSMCSSRQTRPAGADHMAAMPPSYSQQTPHSVSVLQLSTTTRLYSLEACNKFVLLP